MKKYYTSTIPAYLARALQTKGMPIEAKGENILCPSYAEVVRWFMSSYHMNISVTEWFTGMFKGYVSQDTNQIFESDFCGNWHKAAEAAINKALELI